MAEVAYVTQKNMLSVFGGELAVDRNLSSYLTGEEAVYTEEDSEEIIANVGTMLDTIGEQ